MQVSFHIRLQKVIYVPDFRVNLLSISTITKQLLYYVTFLPFHCTFQMGKRIDLRHGKKNNLLIA